MKVLAFYNGKGGVGKTTSSINVAYILSSVHKKRVLLCDLDYQCNCTGFFDSNETPMFSGSNIADVLLHNCPAEQAIHKTKFDRLDLIPSTKTLERVEKQLAAPDSQIEQISLPKAFKDLGSKYDYIVLDLRPAAETLANINGLAIADSVFIPLRCDAWAMQGLEYSIEIINTVKKINYKLSFNAFFTQWESWRRINRETLQQVHQFLGSNLLSTSISRGKSAEEMTYAKLPLLLYDKRSRPTNDYLDLTKEILKILK